MRRKPITGRNHPIALCDCSSWSNLTSGPYTGGGTRELVISTLGWIFLGVTAWLVVATGVGMVIGRTIRLRDRQVLEETSERREAPLEIPTQNSGTHDRRRSR
jgi:hypothetical protein